MKSRAALLCLCVLSCVRTVAAQTRLWNPDERVLISSFNNVGAIAYDGRRVFAATANGLEIYDAISRRWLIPSTIEDGYPQVRPTIAVYDRSMGGLWLSAADARSYFWSDLNGRWQRAFAGNVEAPAFDPDIAFRVLRGTMSLDGQGRRWPVTAVAPADRQGTYWVGTEGGNILFADTRNLSSEWLTYGTLARGVASLAVDSDSSLWFGGDGFGPRDGIVRATGDLQKWTWFEAQTTRAPRRAVTTMLTGATTWAGSVDGLYFLTADARAWQHLNGTDDYVRAMLRSPAGVWVGTERGLWLMEEATRSILWKGMTDIAITGLVMSGDTLWAASSRGVWTVTRDSAGVHVVQPAFVQASAFLRGPMFGIAHTGQGVQVLANDGLYNLVAGQTARVHGMPPIGRTYALRSDQHAVYVLGESGVARWQADHEMWSYLSVPGDIPEGPVRDVLVSGEFTWIATPAGAMRIQWR